jgi:hypothetical protein
MADPARIEKMLTMLGELWREYPHLRFGQLASLIHNRAQTEGRTKAEMFYIDDKDVHVALEYLLRYWKGEEHGEELGGTP